MASKRILFLFFLGFILPASVFGQRFWVASSSGNWNNSANWSATSGGSGGASVPTSADAAIFNGAGGKNGTCVITTDVVVAGLSLTGYSGQITVSSSNLSINGAATFNTGTIATSGVGSTLAIVTTGNATFAGTVFSIPLTVTAGNLLFNGSTFNNTVAATKFATGVNQVATGGNTFNGVTSITNASSADLILANITADRYNSDVTFSNTSTARLYVSGNSSNNRFNGNVVVNSTSGSGVTFNNGAASSSILAVGKTLTIGGLGFSAGSLTLNRFSQIGSAPTTLGLTGSASLTIGSGTVFNGNISCVAPDVLLSGGTFHGTAYFEKTGAIAGIGTGGNIFNGTTTLKNTGSTIFYLGNGNADIFNADLSLINAGSNSSLRLANTGSGHQFNGNVSIESTSMGATVIGSGSSTMASGKTFQIGTSGFSTGSFQLYNFTKVGTTPLNLTFGGTTFLYLGSGCVFNGNVSCVAPELLLNGGTFQGTAYFEKTGATAGIGTGGNTFNGPTTLKNTGSNVFFLGNGNADIFNADLFLINAGSNSSLRLANTGSGHQFNGNVSIESTSTGATVIGSGSSTMASGKTLQIGASGFSTGSFQLYNFTKAGTTPLNLTFGGTTFLYLGSGCIFNGNVSCIAPELLLNGGTFQGTAYFEKTGASAGAGTGGNTFNGLTTLKNTGSSYFILGNGAADIFNADLSLINDGSNSTLQLASNSSGTQFNGNVSIESSSAGATLIGGGSSTIASGKTIQVGASGFSAGSFQLYKFTKAGPAPLNLTLTGTATLLVGAGCVFDGDVSCIAPSILLNQSTYNGTSYFEKTGSGGGQSTGGNTFNGATTLKNSSPNNFVMGAGSADIFNGNLTLASAGSGGAAVFVAYAGNGHQLNGNVIIESTSGGGVAIGSGTPTSAWSAELKDGKTILVGPAGFSSGGLYLSDFRQIGTTPMNVVLTGSALFFAQDTTSFDAAVSFTAPRVLLSNSTFNGVSYFEKTGTGQDNSTGGNLFKENTTFKNSGSSNFVLAGTIADKFLKDATFENTGAGSIFPAHNSANNIFEGNIIVQSSAGSGIFFSTGANGSAELTSGKILIGPGGFTSGGLVLTRFDQLGTQATSLTLTANAYFSVGPSTIFTADVTVTSPGVILNGANFKANTLINKNGAQASIGTGNNVFDGTVVINNSGTGAIQTHGSNVFNNVTTLSNTSSGNIALELINGSTYNKMLSITNQGAGIIYIGHAGATSLNDNVTVSSTAGFGVYFGQTSTASITLASGKTLTVGPLGFTSGELRISRFTQSGNTAQNLTFGNSAGFRTGPAAIWGGNVNFSAGRLFLDGTTFSGTSVLSKTGAGGDSSTGGNDFIGDATINVSSTAIVLGNTNGDTFHGNVTFNVSQSSKIYPALQGSTTIAGNVTIQNLDASAVEVIFGYSAIGGIGTTILNGSADQAISSNFTPTFFRLVLDKPSGVVNLNTPVNINVSSTFTSGIINSSATNYVNFANGSSSIGGSEASFVNGPVRKTGNNAFTFPIGSSSGGSSVFRPVSMSAPSTTADVFVAQYFRQPQAFGAAATFQSPIVAVNGCEYFSFTRINGSSNPKLTLSWRRSDCAADLFTSDQSKHVVALWTGSNWITQGNSATSGDATAGTVTSNAVTGFGNFAVGYTAILSNSLTFTACSGASVGFFPTSDVVSATYSWTRAAVAGVSPGSTSGTGSISEVLMNSTSSPIVVTYQIVTSTVSSSSAPEMLTVTLNPSPSLTSTSTPSAICSSSAFVYTPTSSLSNTTFSWTRPVLSGISQSANSGTGSINEQLNNTTADPVSVVYNYTLSANGCHVPQAVTVVVNPSPQLNVSLTPSGICSTNSFSYTLSSNTTGAMFTWTRTSVAGIIQPANSGATAINEQLTNSTAFPITVPYLVITSANGCSNGPSGQTVSVVVNPIPQLTSSLSPAAICSNNVFGYTPTSLTPGTAYSWSRASVTGLTQSAATGTGQVNETLTNTTTNPVNAVYDFTLSANGCTNNQLVTIAVKPMPVLTSVLTPAPICSGTAFVYTPVSSLSGTTYAWSRPAVSGISQSSGTGTGSINEIITNITSAPVSVVYNYNLTSNGCSAPQAISVVINPTPQLSTLLTPPAICSGSIFGYTLASATTGTSFSWTRGSLTGINESASNGTSAIAEQLTNSTSSPVIVAYVVISSANGCNNGPSGQTISVVVNPTPQLSSPVSASPICSSSTFTYTPTSFTSGATYSWSRASVLGISQSASAGTGSVSEQLINTTTGPVSVIYSFTLAANGCSNVQNVAATINPTPVLSSVLTPVSICSNTAFIYSPTASVPGTTFSWSRPLTTGISEPAGSGTGSVSEQLTNTTVNPVSVTYNYTLTANSCSNPQAVTVVVNPTPNLSSSLAPPAICSTASFSYALTSATAGASFSWSRASIAGITEAASSGSSTINEQLTNSTSAVVIVSYVVITSANGCNNGPAGQTVSVVVNPTPQLSSTILPSAVCSNNAFTYTPASLTSGVTFSWTRAAVAGISQSSGTGIGAVNEQLNNTTSDPVSVVYNYTLNANSCSGYQLITVVVNPTPQVNSALTAAPICSGVVFDYNFTSATTGTSYAWTRASVTGIAESTSTGTGSINEQLTNSTPSPLTVPYVVVATANGCSNGPSGQTLSVVVNPTPQLSSLLNPGAICSTNTFGYTPTSATAGTMFSWNRAFVTGISQSPTTGMGSISEPLTNTTNSPLNVVYDFGLAANGCTNDQLVTVSVNPTPGLTSLLTPAAICSSTTFAYSPTSSLSGTTFSWSRPAVSGISESAGAGTGAVSEQLTNITSSPISVIYNYNLTANGCSAPQAITVVVNPTPQLSSSLLPAAICSGSTFLYNFSSSTTGASFSWTRASVPGINEGSSNGTSLISEQLTNSTISPVTVPYVVVTSANGCNNGSSGQTVSVTVNPTPQLSSSLTANAICSNNTFTYTPTSLISGATYFWSRASVTGISQSASTGAGSVSEQLTNTTTTPVNVVYTFSLGANGCNSIQNVTAQVNPTPVLSSIVTPAAICSNTTFSYAPASAVTGTTFSWIRPSVNGISESTESGSGPISEILTNTTANSVSVPYTYTLTANGCSAFQAVTAVVNPMPVLSSALTAPAICSGSSVTYNFASATAGATYAWSRAAVTGISETASSGTASINEQLTNSTAAPVMVSYLVITSANGCNNGPSGQTVSVAVNPTPQLTSVLNPAPICSATTFNYTPSALPPGTTYSWIRRNISGIKEGLASSSGPINEVLTNQTAQTLDVTYNFVLLANGCSKNQSISVTVNPTPVLNSVLAQTICSGDLLTSTLSTETIGGTFSWSRSIVSGISQAASSGTGSQIAEVLTNTTAQQVSVPYIITTSVNGCSNAGQLLQVTVNPRPTLSSVLSGAICSGGTFDYTPTSLTSGTTFAWSRGAKSGVTPLTASGQGEITETLTNSTVNAIHINYSIVPTFSGCEGTTASLDLKVGAIPNVNITSPPPVCPNQKADLTVSGITAGSEANLQYSYFTDQSLQTQVSDPTNVAEGTYYIKGTNSDGCVKSGPVIITFKIVGELTSSLEQSATCSPAVFDYIPTASISGSTFTWTRIPDNSISEASVNGSGEIHEAELTNTSQSTVVVKYLVITSTGQCSNLGDTVKLPIFPIPGLSSSLDGGTVSNGEQFLYEPTSLVSGSSFEWSRPAVTGILEGGNSGHGTISEILHNTTSTPIGIQYGVVITANGCTGPEQFVTLMVGPYETVKIPEGFSPNGDGINDMFEIINTSGFPSEVRIFDRWGKLLYSNENYQNDWSGATLPDGTYYSVVKVGKFLKKHALTIHR